MRKLKNILWSYPILYIQWNVNIIGLPEYLIHTNVRLISKSIYHK